MHEVTLGGHSMTLKLDLRAETEAAMEAAPPEETLVELIELRIVAEQAHWTIAGARLKEPPSVPQPTDRPRPGLAR